MRPDTARPRLAMMKRRVVTMAMLRQMDLGAFL
jgi:hypothetical protein